MKKVGFFTAVHYRNPQTVKESFVNFVEGHLHFSGKIAVIIEPKGQIAELQNHSISWAKIAIKITVWVGTLGGFPALIFILKVGHRLLVRYHLFVPQPTPILPDKLQEVLIGAPEFKGYQVGIGTCYADASLSSISLRPANFFYNALFKRPDAVTLPGSGELFAFRIPHQWIREHIRVTSSDTAIAFSANGISGSIHSKGVVKNRIPDLAHLYGGNTYQISYQEIKETLASQKIYLAPGLPKPFYSALKQAMDCDGIVTLPEDNPYIKDLKSVACAKLIADIMNDYTVGGFRSEQERDNLFNLTLYHLGSLVVKSEDYRIFMDGNGKILKREPGQNDAIRLINACGIRPPAFQTASLVTQMYRSSLFAAGNGYLIVPAVGMGVWGGDPDLYWRAFLNAVALNESNVEQIFVNPNHQTTQMGRYAGCKGEEFQEILNTYLILFANDPAALANLRKIVNLSAKKTDVVQLSYLLKKQFPEKTVSLMNASDPDVTLGWHVGEYVNNLDHAKTTEENYTAMGSNGLCHEKITGVHEDPSRIIPVF